MILHWSFSVTDSPATLYGKSHEADAIKKLSEECGISISEPSKFVPSDDNWLVCIPDGIVYQHNTDASGDGDKIIEAIVEVKCLHRCRNEPFESFINDDSFCLERNEEGETEDARAARARIRKSRAAFGRVVAPAVR